MRCNYRVARKKREYIFNHKVCTSYEYIIVQAFYDTNGKIGLISKRPEYLVSENIEHLIQEYQKIKEAFYQPILDYDMIPEPGYEPSKDSLAAALNQLDLWEKLNDEEMNFKEIEDYEKEEEIERKKAEKLFNYFIKEFIHSPSTQFKLEDFYKRNV